DDDDDILIVNGGVTTNGGPLNTEEQHNIAHHHVTSEQLQEEIQHEEEEEEEINEQQVLLHLEKNQEDDAYRDVEFMTPELLRILNRTEYMKGFYKWLLWEQSLENLLFLVDLMHFKESIVTQVPPLNKVRGWRMSFPSHAIPGDSKILKAYSDTYDRMELLYELYIPTHAELHVNLLPRSQTLLKWRFDGGDLAREPSPDRCMIRFDEAAKEVSQLLFHSLERFMASQVLLFFFFFVPPLFDSFYFICTYTNIPFQKKKKKRNFKH
ncbi:hypothetical protein RFI_24286, partial [Reticulomyxa filosa]